MADFCNQCARDHHLPEGDLARPDADPPPKGMGYPALCEGCGPTHVDEKGNCVSPYCEPHHAACPKHYEERTQGK